MSFYHPRCIDPFGGYFGFFREDGIPRNPATKHLVGTTRAIINYSLVFQEFGGSEYVAAIRHGINFLRQAHRNDASGGYAWMLRDGRVSDSTYHCYGLAFVMLAYARAVQAGVTEARPYLYETWGVLEHRFWEQQFGLYADEANEGWIVSSYRGQNANMHLCEAFIAAFEASGDSMFLQRASRLADNMANRQAAHCNGQIWEHYRADWQPDWEYNKGDRSNIFRPWGLQPGHQVEWAKLLIQLDRHAPEPWYLTRARELFTVAVESAWDHQHGGLIYGYDPQGLPYDSDKYSWVQIEAMAAAALLGGRTGEAYFSDWYAKLADYCARVFVDAGTGCWYRLRKPDNTRWPEEAPFSCLTEYHTFSAYFDIMKVLQAQSFKSR